MRTNCFCWLFGLVSSGIGTTWRCLMRSSRLRRVVCSSALACAGQRLSEQDLPTLRFDYPGTGDSADDDETPDRVRAWVESIGDAVRTLRRIAGVERVALVGLRMGAMLAIAAAEEIDDLAALVLLAPIGSGEDLFPRTARLGEDAGEGAPPSFRRG